MLAEIEKLQKKMHELKNEMAIIEGNYRDVVYGYNKYHHSKIYKIVSDNTEDCYVGSTTKSLYERMKRHVENFKYYKKYNKSSNITSFKILEMGDYSIELIENVCCENVKELRKIEGLWQKNTPNCINKVIAGRTMKESQKEYYEKNKLEQIQKVSANYEKKKDEINEKRKIKYTCECGTTLRRADKACHNKTKHHKQYINNIK